MQLIPCLTRVSVCYQLESYEYICNSCHRDVLNKSNYALTYALVKSTLDHLEVINIQDNSINNESINTKHLVLIVESIDYVFNCFRIWFLANHNMPTILATPNPKRSKMEDKYIEDMSTTTGNGCTKLLITNVHQYMLSPLLLLLRLRWCLILTHSNYKDQHFVDQLEIFYIVFLAMKEEVLTGDCPFPLILITPVFEFTYSSVSRYFFPCQIMQLSRERSEVETSRVD